METEQHELTADAEAFQEQFQHVYWIGGGSGAGKTTIAHRIAAEHDLQLYATDEVMLDHSRRSTPERCPFLHQFMAMDMDERWVNRSPKAMLETFHWFRGEGFGIASAEDRRSARLALTTEGLLLDDYYGAKAMTLFRTLLADGAPTPAVYWHTGGVAAALAALTQGAR